MHSFSHERACTRSQGEYTPASASPRNISAAPSATRAGATSPRTRMPAPWCPRASHPHLRPRER
eukprot:9203249-Alexandrium_andersonii.AAC.1